MRNVPVNLAGFKLRVVEEPAVKVDQEGVVKTVYGTDDPLYVVGVFAKPVATEDGYRGKGSEFKVTLATNPGDVAEGDVVELNGPTVSLWEMDGRSGLSWKAASLKPVG